MNLEKRAELFRQLRTKYAGFIYSMIWKLTGDRELFTEAVQYTLLGMWQNIEKLEGKKAAAYIYRIVLTANSKAWKERIGKNGHFSGDRIGSRPGPLEQLDKIELSNKIRKAISRLPAKQGTAIVMRYFEQHDYDTIAIKLNCSNAGARSHVSKALESLRKNLAHFAEQE